MQRRNIYFLRKIFWRSIQKVPNKQLQTSIHPNGIQWEIVLRRWCGKSWCKKLSKFGRKLNLFNKHKARYCASSQSYFQIHEWTKQNPPHNSKKNSTLPKRHKNLGIKYVKEKDSKLVGYTDSDWAGSIDDCKSSSGYLFCLGTKLISWSSKK